MPDAALELEPPWHAAVVKAARAGDFEDAHRINDTAQTDLDEANRLGEEYLGR